ncbi:MAG: CDP-glucose 4,6-dehydratase [Acetobacteraceae bacterium]|nr:CDP-glucose 4,6-dehydratase [Acetobacteraceae bacterium]
MEKLALMPFSWGGKRVLVTGHTGFKGAWLSLCLAEHGAQVFGYALPPATEPNLFELAGLDRVVTSTFGDINDQAALARRLDESQPEIVFHLAAQALVRASYGDPVGTFATNVGGVVSLLHAVRNAPSVKAVVVVTSDKCYDNKEWVWGYRETDPLGGRDPYSASKGAAEIAVRSMQMSFFQPYAPAGHSARVATMRAGNVIGGGDWSDDRLVPDIIKGCLGPAGEVVLRNPAAVRPWQHVLEPVEAYLRVAALLCQSPEGIDEAWNVGPEASDIRAVGQVAQSLVAQLGTGRVRVETRADAPHEANLLVLDCSKARARLGWNPALTFDECIAFTADWYATWHAGRDMAAFTREQIAEYRRRLLARTDLPTSRGAA